MQYPVLIVGGSSGVGAAMLQKLSGQKTIINFSRRQPQISGPDLTHHSLDVLRDTLPSIEALSGLVYCPGNILLKPFRSLDSDDFDTALDINLKGAVRVIQQYEKALKKSDNAAIVLFSTVAVGQGMPFHACVAAAKGAVEGLARALAAEFAPTIRVNVIAPTITDTPLASHILRNEKAVEKARERHPLRRIAAPAELAGMASFLLSDESASITGQVIGIDAGLSTLRT